MILKITACLTEGTLGGKCRREKQCYVRVVRLSAKLLLIIRKRALNCCIEPMMSGDLWMPRAVACEDLSMPGANSYEIT